MFEKSNKTVNILIIVIGVLSTLLIGILFFSNMRQNELTEEFEGEYKFDFPITNEMVGE